MSAGSFSLEYPDGFHMSLVGLICVLRGLILQALDYFVQLLNGNEQALLWCGVGYRPRQEIVCGNIEQYCYLDQKVNRADSAPSLHAGNMVAVDAKALRKLLLRDAERLSCALQSLSKTTRVKSLQWRFIVVHHMYSAVWQSSVHLKF